MAVDCSKIGELHQQATCYVVLWLWDVVMKLSNRAAFFPCHDQTARTTVHLWRHFSQLRLNRTHTNQNVKKFTIMVIQTNVDQLASNGFCQIRTILRTNSRRRVSTCEGLFPGWLLTTAALHAHTEFRWQVCTLISSNLAVRIFLSFSWHELTGTKLKHMYFYFRQMQ